MNWLKVVSLFLCISCMYGCATVARGTNDMLVIESEPPGADVEIQPAKHLCKTPCSVKLKRKHEQVVSIRLTGFEPMVVNVVPKDSDAGAAGLVGNLLVGGIIGAVTDVASGAVKDLKPNPIKVNLVAIKPVPPADAAPVTDPAIAPVAPADAPSEPAPAVPAVVAESAKPVVL